jgi:DNA-binding CsgD family transcriptional regulator
MTDEAARRARSGAFTAIRRARANAHRARGGVSSANVTNRSFSVDEIIHDFAHQMKVLPTIRAVGSAIMPVAALFKMTNLLISDIAKVMAAPEAVLVFSARSLTDIREFAQRIPFATNPVLQLAWASPAPLSLTEIREALNLDPEGLWRLLPPWTRGCEGLSINVQLDQRTTWNLSYSGVEGDVSAAARSVLLVVSRMACERLRDIEYAVAEGARMSAREEEALRLAAAGKSDTDIGREMGIAARTVRFHIDNAKQKLGVASRAQAVLKFLRGRRP